MRMISVLMLSASLLATPSLVTAQALPGTPPAFTLSQAALNALLAQCRAGACSAGVAAIIAQARAAGLDGAQLNAVIASIAATLVEAAGDEPELATQIAAAVEVLSAEASGELTFALEEVVALIESGAVDDVDLDAIAQAATSTTNTDDEVEEAPGAGETGSNA